MMKECPGINELCCEPIMDYEDHCNDCLKKNNFYICDLCNEKLKMNYNGVFMCNPCGVNYGEITIKNE